MNYAEWIAQNCSDTFGKCHELCLKMQAVYPELKLARGFYECPIWGAREHWWLVAVDGTIIDPTADQFPSRGIGEYRELGEDYVEPIGRCLECGEYVFPPRMDTFCCDEHEAAFAASF